MWVACPEVAGARPQDVVLAWKELVPNPVAQSIPSSLTTEERVQQDKEADQEIEALLLGRADSDLTASQALPAVDHDHSAALPSVFPEAESEEETDDRQSDKVGA